MKKFICPIDDRIKISLPDEFPMTQVIYSNGVGVEFSIANCKPGLPPQVGFFVCANVRFTTVWKIIEKKIAKSIDKTKITRTFGV